MGLSDQGAGVRGFQGSECRFYKGLEGLRMRLQA